MGYHDHDLEPDREPRDALGLLRAAISIGVRLLGVVLVVVGLWAAWQVIAEGWALYRDPVRIERLAAAVEKGSNLDAVLTSPAPGAVEGEVAPAPAADVLRLSYFAAWLIALMLLAVIGALATAAFSAGGRLALGGESLGEARRSLAREVRALRRAA